MKEKQQNAWIKHNSSIIQGTKKIAEMSKSEAKVSMECLSLKNKVLVQHAM